MNFGFTACHSSVPSTQKLAVYTLEALVELESVLLAPALPLAAPRRRLAKPAAGGSAQADTVQKLALAKKAAPAKKQATPAKKRRVMQTG